VDHVAQEKDGGEIEVKKKKTPEEELCANIINVALESGLYPIPRLAEKIRMSPLTLAHLMEDQGEVTTENIDGLPPIWGIKIYEDDTVEYGFAEVHFNDGTIETHRVRVRIRIRV
jgi:hypothetical protein